VAEILIMTETIYRRRPYMDETMRRVITLDQIAEVIKRAGEPGQPQEYILRQDG
jgi:hypothetical protein